MQEALSLLVSLQSHLCLTLGFLFLLLKRVSASDRCWNLLFVRQALNNWISVIWAAYFPALWSLGQWGDMFGVQWRDKLGVPLYVILFVSRYRASWPLVTASLSLLGCSRFCSRFRDSVYWTSQAVIPVEVWSCFFCCLLHSNAHVLPLAICTLKKRKSEEKNQP